MSARLLKPSLSLILLLTELRYSLSRFIANPLTAGFVSLFQALRDQWTLIQAQEISLYEALSDARAQVDIADAALDSFAARLSAAILVITGQKRDDPLYLHYFKKSLSVTQKPKLAEQLKVMAAWIDSLNTSVHPTLKAMHPELVTLVAAGKTASDTRAERITAIRKFREVGERFQLFTAVNGERKIAHGALGKLALETPGVGADFASSFFKPAEDDDEPEETIESVTEEIDELEEKLEELKARLVELQEEASKEKVVSEKKAAAKAELAALKKDIEEKKKKAKELEDDLE